MICTFYSYKGGVGRSMALANVAEWMYLNRQLRVVVVDWDLEAPGIESFFPTDDRDGSRLRHPGLVDLLLDYVRDLPYLSLPPVDAPREEVVRALSEQLPPLRTRLLPLRASSAPDQPAVWLLPAGRRDEAAFAAYARAVQRFDWSEFYERQRGEAFFEWLRAELLAKDLADVVLIDTRTGISEMGGVATRQLADVIVSLCALNTQNIEGVAAATRSFLRPEVLEARGRPLEVLVVPTRIETTEITLRNQAQTEFTLAVEDLRPAAMKDENRMFWDLGIPQVAKYAYREKLAVGVGDAAAELVEAYGKLAAQILALAPPGSVARSRAQADVVRHEPVPLPAVSNLRPRPLVVAGRDSELAEMRSRLTGNGAPLALYGIGGVGKSTLALEYAYRFQSGYQLTWWIDARTPEGVARGYLALAGQLGIFNATGDAAIDAARNWLAANSGWLLILDDADDANEIEPQIPHERRGHVLLTSRNAIWRGRVATAMEVAPLGRDDAVALLRDRIGEGDPVAIARIADVLGGLPLALDLAAAYMETTGRSAQDYVGILEHEGVGFLADTGSADAESVSTSLERSYRAVLREPAARDLLAFCCLLGRDSVPLDLFGGAGSVLPILAARTELDHAIVGLRRHSLASVRDSALTVHPLLAAYVREWLGPDAPDWALKAVAATRLALKLHAPAAPAVDRLLPHARAALEHAWALGVSSGEPFKLLADIAYVEESLGRLGPAREDHDLAVREAVARLRPADPTVDQLARERVAFLLRHGNLVGAAAALTEDSVWADKARSLDVPLRVLGDAGVIALRLDDLAQAEEFTLAALQVVKPSDQQARLLLNLAEIQRRRGDPTAAEQAAGVARALPLTPTLRRSRDAACDAFERGDFDGLLKSEFEADGA